LEYTGIHRHSQLLPKKNSNGSAPKRRIDKWGYMKLKTFCTTKEMVTK
jgi:hypothetical protein